jgi:hypothetical protein
LGSIASVCEYNNEHNVYLKAENFSFDHATVSPGKSRTLKLFIQHGQITMKGHKSSRFNEARGKLDSQGELQILAQPLCPSAFVTEFYVKSEHV